MAEEPKKKIDLKARLGKGSAQQGGGSVPLPVPGAIPPPIGGDPSGIPAPAPSANERPSVPGRIPAPPAGLSPGIPLPAFAPAVAPKPAAAAPAAPQAAAAQTIKVEIGEEIQEERKRAGRQKIVFAALGAVVGIGLGFVVGGMKERSSRADQAVSGAGALEADVRTANKKMEELSVMLDQGAEAIGAKKFPDDLAQGLGAMQIPFDSNSLQGKSVGSLPGKVFRNLLIYTKEVEDLNGKKDSLRNLLTALKKPVEQAWADEKDPKFSFSVIFNGSPEKMTAELVRVKDPFSLKGDWPKDYTLIVKQMVQGKPKDADKKANRWMKGDLTGDPPNAIPVDPKSVAAFSSDQVILQLRKAMLDVKLLLDGDKSDPQNETNGLVKAGDALANDLNQISLKR